MIKDKQTGSGLKVLGSDPRRMHGLQYSLCLCDEVAQWEENKLDKALSAIRTSRGKIPGSKIIYIGTKPAQPEHPFELELQSGKGYSQIHAANPTDKPFHRRTWFKANPSLNHLPDLEAVIREEVDKARQSAMELSSFKPLRLNQGVSDTVESVLLEAHVWERIEVETIDPTGAYCLGLDLGTTTSMSAAAAYWYRTGELDGFGCFASEPGLAARGLDSGCQIFSQRRDCFKDRADRRSSAWRHGFL